MLFKKIKGKKIRYYFFFFLRIITKMLVDSTVRVMVNRFANDVPVTV